MLGADIAGDDLACRHPDAGLDLGHLVGQPIGYGPGGGQRGVFGTVEAVRGSEDGQGGVACELVDQSVVTVDLVDGDREKPVEELDHVGGRLVVHQLGGADDVDEDDGGVAVFAA
ncbi:Uncharacterised protein [Mycobacterium tuberculosis]|nr:Uncharacterised protein [Mycobacterium tuberculosis]